MLIVHYLTAWSSCHYVLNILLLLLKFKISINALYKNTVPGCIVRLCSLSSFQNNLPSIAFPKMKSVFLTEQFSVFQNQFQFSSAAQLCLTLCDPMDRSTSGLSVHHQLPEFTQTHAHRVGDAIQPSHPLSSPSPPAPNLSQHQGLFQWVNPSHEVAKVLEFQLQHQSFQWTPRTDLL